VTRILLTGASGQIGRAIAAHLVAEGFVVFGVSRHGSAVSGLTEHLQLDISKPDFVDRAVQGMGRCDAIVHAAASLSKDAFDPDLARTNCLGTQQVTALARAWAVTRLAYVSSVPVIGKPLQHPIAETHPASPATAYHATKLFGEELVRLAARPGLVTCSLRIASPIGPGTPADRIAAAFARRARAGERIELLGRGGRRQNYIDVRDVARAVGLWLSRPAPGVFIIPGWTISNRDLAETCVRLFGSPAAVIYADRPDPEETDAWDLCGDRAEAAFGYRPSYTLDDSLRRMTVAE
jgi:nucleoside-diphosphate-sugar epimerase